MLIKEGISEDVVESVGINVQVNSQFSKYNINPPRCINFGAMIFSDTREKEYTINNLGKFPFNF